MVTMSQAPVSTHVQPRAQYRFSVLAQHRFLDWADNICGHKQPGFDAKFDQLKSGHGSFIYGLGQQMYY